LCGAARKDPARRIRVASLGLVDDEAVKRFLIDATPDFVAQLEALNDGREAERARPVDGILLTHAHIGHYTGLMYLGREALGARAVPVYATPRMARFLRENGPWSQLVTLGNIELREIEPGREIALTPDLRVTPVLVAHRDEYSDTVGFRVRGPSRSLLYIPDIDKWEKWDRRLEDFLADPDLTAFVDGTFFSADEISGRSMAEVPHPFVPETMARVAVGSPEARRLVFVHLNHTNRLLWDAKAVREVEEKGPSVACEGQRIRLSSPGE
jgi:pyrroloquinoline quinone biosynthesis protein B